MQGKKRRIFLTIKEREQLKKISRKLTAPYKLVMRAKIILMADEENPHRKISNKLNMSHESVCKWVKRWGSSDYEGSDAESRLKDLYRTGSPNKFTMEQKCKIVSIACEKPEVYKRPITHWTNRELADEVRKHC